MKQIILVTLILIINYLSVDAQENQMYTNKLIEITVNMLDTVNCDKKGGIPIVLLIKNLSNEQISISNPAHWGNCIPFVRYKEEMIPLIKVKQILSHKNDFLIIKSDSICKVKYDFDLDQLLTLKAYSKESLEIFFTFYGEVKLGAGTIKQQINSNIFKVYIE